MSLSFGIVDDRPVFMDAEDDSYFLLEAEDEARFLDELRRGGADPHIHAGHWEVIEQARPPAIARSDLEGSPPLPSWWLRDVLRVARLLRNARCAVHRQPIAATLAALASRSFSEGEDLLIERLRRFTAARRLVPIAPHCLMDSLALLHFLPPSPKLLLVFGVKLDPFGAHCWVQRDDVLLNDSKDLVAPFQPVRVVRCASATR